MNAGPEIKYSNRALFREFLDQLYCLVYLVLYSVVSKLGSHSYYFIFNTMLFLDRTPLITVLWHCYPV